MKKVVVLGNGMVGSRFAEDLLGAVDDVSVTVIGAEAVAPYNRVLLSSVVAGTAAVDVLELPETSDPRATVLRGVAAVSVDRKQRTVTDSAGDKHEYDHLVFATGSAARIPGVQGIAYRDGFIPGVSVLKDLADAERILKHMKRARRAVVLGAGVLGLEVATSLAAQGIAVTAVHHADRLMERQLGAQASAMTAHTLAELGISVITSAAVVRAITRRDVLSAVALDDGTEIGADMLVMCAGTIPEATLARTAGLECGRGVVVDDTLTSPTDPRVHAIGDCAEPPEGSSGLVAQGWDQARRLVTTFAGGGLDEVPAPAQSEVVRVKAVGLNVVAIGRTPSSAVDARTVALTDPSRGRFIEVAVRDQRLVGATCIGDPEAAARLSAMYERRTPVPRDPAHLLVAPMGGGTVAAPSDPSELGDDDALCRCNSVSKATVVDAIRGGCSTKTEVARATRATTGCGDCTRLVECLLETNNDAEAAPALASAVKG